LAIHTAAQRQKTEQQMKALARHGKGNIRCEEVPDPKIETFRDKKDGCIKVVLKPGMKEPAHV
jgi:hypothetical protein